MPVMGSLQATDREIITNHGVSKTFYDSASSNLHIREFSDMIEGAGDRGQGAGVGRVGQVGQVGQDTNAHLPPAP